MTNTYRKISKGGETFLAWIIYVTPSLTVYYVRVTQAGRWSNPSKCKPVDVLFTKMPTEEEIPQAERLAGKPNK